jgi:hypothetical protein
MEQAGYKCVSGMYFRILGEITFQGEWRWNFGMKKKCGCISSLWLNGFSCFNVRKCCSLSSELTRTLFSVDGRPFLWGWNYLFLFCSKLSNIRAKRWHLFWQVLELLKGYDENENPSPGRPCINEKEPKSAPLGISIPEDHIAPQYLEVGRVITARRLITKSCPPIVSESNSMG